VIFHHRTGAKWEPWGDNLRVPGFAYEEICLQALAELRELWDGRVDLESLIAVAPVEEAGLLRIRYFLYWLRGRDERVLALLPGGKIGEGRADWEERWRLEQAQGRSSLVIEGRRGDTCRLARGSDGVWRGR
jgi:hypothetical protein